VSDPSGNVIPLGGQGVLKIVFTEAQAHTADGTRSSIAAQPAPRIGYDRIADYAQGGDFEGVLTYGIGISWPAGPSNPQIAVRAYEVQTVTDGGRHLYTVAIDVDAGNPA
ncbi:MAG: AMIN-like domain-containing (lipo)protein, partial [Trebonia sp.]